MTKHLAIRHPTPFMDTDARELLAHTAPPRNISGKDNSRDMVTGVASDPNLHHVQTEQATGSWNTSVRVEQVTSLQKEALSTTNFALTPNSKHEIPSSLSGKSSVNLCQGMTLDDLPIPEGSTVATHSDENVFVDARVDKGDNGLNKDINKASQDVVDSVLSSSDPRSNKDESVNDPPEQGNAAEPLQEDTRTSKPVNGLAHYFENHTIKPHCGVSDKTDDAALHVGSAEKDVPRKASNTETYSKTSMNFQNSSQSETNFQRLTQETMSLELPRTEHTYSTAAKEVPEKDLGFAPYETQDLSNNHEIQGSSDRVFSRQENGAGEKGDTSLRKRARSPESSEDDDFPTQPPPRPTIRLNLALSREPKSKSDYIFSIPKLAVQEHGDEHPKWARWYSATHFCEGSAPQDVGVSAQELKNLGGLAKLLQKYPTKGHATHLSQKRRLDEYDVGSYDTKDPFVDDSELGVDEPTHIVKTRTDGFYVAQGPIELAPARSSQPASRSASAFRSSIGQSMHGSSFAGRTNKLLAKRAASRRLEATPAASSVSESQGTANESTPPQQTVLPPSGTPKTSLTDHSQGHEATTNPDPPPATVRPFTPQDHSSSGESRTAEKKKNKYPTRPVHPQLQNMFDHLKTLAQRASFAVKTKFPPELKPPLIETAKLAVELDEYNDNFFNYLPSIFPYNRFTMMKLTKREFFHKHMEYFKDLQEEHVDRLYELFDKSFPEQVAEYEALCQERGVEGRDNTEQGDEVDEDNESRGDTDELVRRFRWTDEMREELFTIVTVENAMSEIRNEKLCVLRK